MTNKFLYPKNHIEQQKAQNFFHFLFTFGCFLQPRISLHPTGCQGLCFWENIVFYSAFLYEHVTSYVHLAKVQLWLEWESVVPFVCLLSGIRASGDIFWF
jgi:hypothetical protein